MNKAMRDLIDEYWRAYDKHGPMTLDGEGANDLHRLSTLTEEIGEVARAMTYDEKKGPQELRKELIQVANLALTWASVL